MNIRKSRLYEYILSDVNIFNAIYSLESYIYEKELLSDDDIALYYKLTDKFDFENISTVIQECQQKIGNILTNNDELFDIQVYFKLKKYNAETQQVEYRPIHSARLIDQICMVSLLNAIMYEIPQKVNPSIGKSNIEETIIRNAGKKLSGLAKLLPSNFYGNIPSTQPERLFVDWKPKYKEYSDAVINKYYDYSQTNKYSHEVCLDIKEFYPNIDPRHILGFITNKLSLEFKTSDDDLHCLTTIVSKLLCFKLSNMTSYWSEAYYSGVQTSEKYYSRGIPQGLPQSYFFGNICMIEIAKCIEKYYIGDAYYYVDDSVVYTNTGLDKIKEINNAIKKINWRGSSKEELCIDKQCSESYDKLQYSIEIHPSGVKSSITPIGEAYSGLKALRAIAGLTSNVNNAIYLSIDEIEDTSTAKKIKAIIDAISFAKEQISRDKNEKSTKYALKLLNRYRRFFLFRFKLIETRDADINTLIADFERRYNLQKYDIEPNYLATFFNLYDEDIFQEEIRLLTNIADLESQKYVDLATKLKEFDCKMAGLDKNYKSSSILYLTKNIEGAIAMSKHNNQKYNSLEKWTASKYKQFAKSNPERVRQQLILSVVDSIDITVLNDAEYAKHVFFVSNEYKRCIVNALISQILNIPISDDFAIYKRDNRVIKYYELRLLLFARNRNFKAINFIKLASDILKDTDAIMDAESVDYKIVPVLHIFTIKVKDPEKVDSLILIHRMISGLWKNGSKFLHFYTLHNEEHSIELIKNVIRLVNTIDYFSLKELDYYILFLACYLHDISMVIHPDLEMFCKSGNESDRIYSDFVIKLCDDLLISGTKPEIKLFILNYFKSVFEYFENSVRNAHAKQSAKFIIDRCDTPYFKFIDNAILQAVAEIAESHGYSSEEVYGRKSFARKKIYSQKYMMILIRLADLLDLSKDRVSYYIMKENIKHMSSTSQFHWISHYITDKCDIRAEFEPVYKSSGKVPIHSLDNGSIIERLCFDIHLNVKQITKVESNDYEKERYCKHVLCRHIHDKDILSISILDKSERMTKNCDECAFLCKWATRKHDYLFTELNSLLRYLNTVNRNLFKTAIDVNIHYENKRDLDPEFSDVIRNYITKS